MLRYRTRRSGVDHASAAGAAAPCARMSKVVGRADDMFIVRGVNVFPSQIESACSAVKGTLPHYQIVLTREGSGRNGGAGRGRAGRHWRGGAQSLGRRGFGHHVKGLIGITAKITVADPGAVERSQGKARRVIDKRPKP